MSMHVTNASVAGAAVRSRNVVKREQQTIAEFAVDAVGDVSRYVLLQVLFEVELIGGCLVKRHRVDRRRPSRRKLRCV